MSATDFATAISILFGKSRLLSLTKGVLANALA